MKAKTTKKTAKTAKKTAKPFVPAADLTIQERGSEFVSLRKKGMKPTAIIALFASFGISVSLPAFYKAVALAQAPAFVREAIASGEVKASDVSPLLNKANESEAALRKALDRVIAKRKARRNMLAKAGFEGNANLTKNRMVHLVGESLQKIRQSGALKDAGAQAVLTFIEALNQGKTHKQLLSLLSK